MLMPTIKIYFKRAPFYNAFIRHLPVSCTIHLAATFAPNPYLRKLKSMKRVVIVGRGASGKSTLARRLGDITGLLVTEVDKIFWQPGLIATPRRQWTEMQEQLVVADQWIMEGDLGPYDAVEVRLRAADTIIFLDFSLVRCAWRAIRRSRERADFWRWLLVYRYQSRPNLRSAMAKHAPDVVLYVFRGPRALARFVAEVGRR
jgi:nicotinamide riboside kinase